MVCDRAKRRSLPFDISHRPVLFYKTESRGDFEQLSKDIEAAVAAALGEAAEKAFVLTSGPLQPGSSLATDAVKRRILLEILEAEMGDPDGLSAYRIKNSAVREGVSERLASLAILGLQRDGLVEAKTVSDQNGDDYRSYTLADSGKDLLLEQYAEIKRSEEDAFRLTNRSKEVHATYDSDLDDDVPF